MDEKALTGSFFFSTETIYFPSVMRDLTMGFRNSLLFSLLMLCCGMAQATSVQKITHADGTVEFRQAAPQASPASAEEPKRSATYYRYRDSKGVLSFSDRAPKTHFYEKVRFDCYACKVKSQVTWETTPLYVGHYDDAIEFYAQQYAVSPALVRAVIHAESNFNPKARSRVGAQGLMQLMPATAKELGVANPLDPEANIEGGVRYLAMMLQRFNRDVRLATAAYNAGPNAVRRHKGVPAYAETQAYVERVAILARRYEQHRP